MGKNKRKSHKYEEGERTNKLKQSIEYIIYNEYKV